MATRTSTAAVFDALESRVLLSTYSLSSIPLLSSNPGARAKLYLDFVGAPANAWGSYSVPATPAFDQDGNASTFSEGELSSIREIWTRIAEAYSPFNIDVTTVNPGNLNHGQTLRAVIGGSGTWTGGTYGGLSYVGSFTNLALPNTVYIFAKNQGNGNPAYTADAAIHEAGHGFGLQHQSVYDSAGHLVSEYNQGNGLVAPNMGVTYYSARGLWWYGPSDLGSTVIQDDLAIISSPTNGFGYRTDDRSNTPATAATMTLSGSTVTASGIIEKRTDSDFYKFTTGPGAVSFSASPATAGGMLDLKLVLYNSAGTLLRTVDTPSLGENLSLTLGAGTYEVGVLSHGGYGDIGQYSLRGTIVSTTVVAQTPAPAPAPANNARPAAPTMLTATPLDTTEAWLMWTDKANNELQFKIERSTDGVHFTEIGTVGANVTGYRRPGLLPGTTYAWRVRAYGAGGYSDYSNVAWVTTKPLAPVPAQPVGIFSATPVATVRFSDWLTSGGKVLN